MQNMRVHIRFFRVPLALSQREWRWREWTAKNWKCRRRRQSSPSARKITGAAKNLPQNTTTIIFPGLFTRFFFKFSSSSLSLFLFFSFFSFNRRKCEALQKGVPRHALDALTSACPPIPFARTGLPVGHAILLLAFTRVCGARNEWREWIQDCVEDPARPACFVFFHLFLSDSSEAHSPRCSSSCVWLSGTSRKRGEGVIVSLILPCSFRHSPAALATVDELNNKYLWIALLGVWPECGNKSLIVLTILSVLYEREFLFLY